MNYLTQIIAKNKFIRNIGIYTISDILNKLVPFLLLPVLTRYLTPSDYGIISIFSVFTSILGVFISLESHLAIGVQYFKIDRDKIKVYIGNVLLMISISTIIIMIIVLILNSDITKLLNLPLEWLIIGVFITVLSLFTTINLILWQSEHNAITFGVYQISQTVVNLTISLVLVVGLGLGWEGRLIASAIAATVFGFLSFGLFFKRDYVKLKVNTTYLKDILKFGLPLLPHSLSAWIRTGIDQLFLTILISSSATGLYTAGFQIASVILVVSTAFDRAFKPFLYEQLSNASPKNKKTLIKYTYFYFSALLLMAFLLSLLGPFIVKLVLGKEFGDSKNYIKWFAFGFAFYGMYSMMVNYVFYTEKTIKLSYLTFVIGLLHVGLSYLLISKNGSIGAVQATTIISFLTFIAVWWLSQKLYPMPWLTVLYDIIKKRKL